MENIFQLKQNINKYFYKEKGIMRFSDDLFRDEIIINNTVRRHEKDFMIFSNGKWEHITEDRMIKIIKKNVLKYENKLIYTDNQFKRILDLIDTKILDFATNDQICEIQNNGLYNVVTEDYIYSVTDNNEITKKKNQGQLYNFVCLPNITLDIKKIQNIEDCKTENTEIDDFLKDITISDESMIKYLQEIVGYSMLYGHLEPYIYIGLGKGSNGKSIFASLMKIILTYSNIVSIEFSDINSQTVSQLEKSFINLPTELSSSRMLPENILKAITDGEPINSNDKYKNPRNIIPIRKQFALANELPSIKDRSDGFWRRAQVIPFDLKITNTSKKKKNKVYFEKLFLDNAESLRNWAFVGLLRLIKNKGVHTECKRIVTASKKYQQENNNVLMFLEDFTLSNIVDIYEDNNIHIKEKKEIKWKNHIIEFFITGNGTSSIKINDLYLMYKFWIQENGYKPNSLKNFINKIEEKSGTNYFEFEFEIKYTNSTKKFFYTNETDLQFINQKMKKERSNEIDNIVEVITY